LKFSRLKHLQLFLNIPERNEDSILYSVSFLRATPFIEDLEVHVSENCIFKFVFYSHLISFIYIPRGVISYAFSSSLSSVVMCLKS
jgi:hypothetical protein